MGPTVTALGQGNPRLHVLQKARRRGSPRDQSPSPGIFSHLWRLPLALEAAGKSGAGCSQKAGGLLAPRTNAAWGRSVSALHRGQAHLGTQAMASADLRSRGRAVRGCPGSVQPPPQGWPSVGWGKQALPTSQGCCEDRWGTTTGKNATSLNSGLLRRAVCVFLRHQERLSPLAGAEGKCGAGVLPGGDEDEATLPPPPPVLPSTSLFSSPSDATSQCRPLLSKLPAPSPADRSPL